ncbi:MAG: hypothetical protein DRH49_04665 [Candidatus Coatesbacteria bacterium]|nr:MAG: hypothetical protein DRH49_04665 [Candidatus Coatesbacteria bacterium]
MKNKDRVFISVIIPTRNRPQLLKRCLQSIFSQKDAPPYEVIVIDDHSDGLETRRVVKSFGAKYKRLPKRMGQAHARNIGLERAEGYIVAFIDDDCIATSNWLKEGATIFEDGVVGGIEGMTIPHPDEPPTPFSNYIDNRTGRQYTTSNMFYRKDVLENIGGFDTTYTEPFFKQLFREDTDVAFKLLSLGFVIPFVDRCAVYHLRTNNRYLKPIKDAVKHFLDPKLAKRFPKLFSKSGFRPLSRGHFPYYLGIPLIITGILTDISTLIIPGACGILLSAVYSTIRRCSGKSIKSFHPVLLFLYELTIVPILRLFSVILGYFKYGKITL